ncbi:elongator complex protein 5 [Tachyglossus aculeatus]|uniref:elongator complex protein 5 n=1 Tax=Tachyglossus aculeatus TaxID=9261 RepID=UPI0018F731C9|nr:elongator complex protein 5 [Tachyglossus aculeatus]
METLAAGGGLVLLRDSLEWEGRSLLKALIQEASHKGEQVQVLGCEVSEEEFRDGFDPETNSRLVYHDVFRDPWAWTGPGRPLEALALLRPTGSVPLTLAVDSLSWLLLRAPCPALCQALRTLTLGDPSTGSRRPRVLGLLHQELHADGPLGSLAHLAVAEVTLGGTGPRATAQIRHRRPGGRVTEQTHLLSVLPDLSLRTQDLPSQGPPAAPPPPAFHGRWGPGAGGAVDPTADLTFNLHLSEEEKEARAALTLPYQFSSEKQRSLLRPSPARIFYELDSDDDLDQDDPDDDLDV